MRSLHAMHVSFELSSNKDKVYVYRIFCNKFFPEKYLEPSLMHEYGHVFIYCHPGSLRNYIHKEYISMVLELLYSLLNEEDIFKETLIRLLYDLKKSIEKLHKQQGGEDSPSYIVSTLEAFQTIDKYLLSSSREQDQIIGDLQSTLNGNKKVEEFLDDYDITFKTTAPQKSLSRILEIVL